ncbi:leucyl-tRNA synthetase [Babesia microti strain RI]|uniref:leucine--tRNA ligase n=1 Tax=Babesia microti (strain RI) TaxID=1133968 RepID=A0A1N6LXQ6_BABMR|nr:leucyl-tRNA synthetase [Babesia microti strain RI]SIO73658.1 leucyl-tRNA synthetase [Babesia microti strain RI]|eukprot:XP_021337733.1 leucyl-tRNA synthetase [Babesia microti strain RI]
MARRSYILDIEYKVQSLWHEFGVNESNVPIDELKPKYFCTFPYPYMNGRLHLGHAFSASKAEFQARFQALMGKQILWPMGFHCTGMPIAACADKIKFELSDRKNDSEVDVKYNSKAHFSDKCDSNAQKNEGNILKYSSKKSKATSKTNNELSQTDIMLKMGIDNDIVHKFADPDFWLTFFPPLAIKDLKRLGFAIDWRRSFITTKRNPYYDRFIKWQFNKLKNLNKLMYGCRPSIISIKTLQPCADHDRSEGEGVGHQEYTVIKLKLKTYLDIKQLVIDDYKSYISEINELPIYLLAATLRPETMYGQTGCFVLPEGDYCAVLGFNNPKMDFNVQGVVQSLYHIKDSIELTDAIYITSSNSLYNLAYQGLIPLNPSQNTDKPPHILFNLTGQTLIGMQIEAPLSVYKHVYVLPMPTISIKKGTGIVTCVPSDSPDDYLMYKDIRNKADYYRTKYNIDPAYVSFDILPIINIPGIGNMCAVTECEKLKIASIKDRIKVDPLKNVLYKRGFYEGVMCYGKYSGQPVMNVKEHIKQDLISSGSAIVYMEPESTVISRNGDTCIVALCNQWYTTFGDENWKKYVHEHVNSQNFICHNESTLNQIKHVVNWLDHWACSRSYGLGTNVMLDNDNNPVLIESLSDSTIYMAYYTISHYFQGDIYGTKPGKFGISATQITDELFDYIFDISDIMPRDLPIEKHILLDAKKEFMYWYPQDIRVSGKDLIFNHLTMSLFIHQAIWQGRYMPMGYFCNGHILVDAEKMSKSKGNFLTIEECIDKYTADGMRVALADAGDTIDDANFSNDTANSALLKLYTLIQICKEFVESTEYRKDDAILDYDKAFVNHMKILANKAKDAYSKFCYRDALKYSYYEMTSLIHKYKLQSGTSLMNREIVLQYLDTLAKILSPICPHTCEYIWRDLLKNDSFVIKQQWPIFEDIDWGIYRRYSMLYKNIDEFRRAKEKAINQLKKKNKNAIVNFTSADIFVASKYTKVQELVLTQLTDMVKNNIDILNVNISNQLLQSETLKDLNKVDKKEALQFASYYVKEEYATRGDSSLKPGLDYCEIEFLELNKQYLKESLQLNELNLYQCDDGTCMPGRPTIRYLSN